MYGDKTCGIFDTTFDNRISLRKQKFVVNDYQFIRYQHVVRRKSLEEFDSSCVSPSDKYAVERTESGQEFYKAAPYSGYTVLADPFPSGEQKQKLQFITERLLSWKIDGFVPVPGSTYHITLADLIANEKYRKVIRAGQLTQFCEVVCNILSPTGLNVTGRICGVGWFPSVVIAIVDFVKEDDYRQIIGLRNKIYSDLELISFGVARTLPFIGHITLGYLTSPAPRTLNDALCEIRGELDNYALDYSFKQGVLYSFNDMSSYQRHP